MPGKLSVWAANKTLEKILRNTDFTFGDSLWVALCRATTDTALRANDIAAAQEVSAAGYARYELSATSGVRFAAAVDGASSLPSQIVWTPATAGWGTITFGAIMDAASGGNVIVYGSLAAPKSIDVGDTAKIPTGMFTVRM